jgi:beta-N-acetylhexosaminidase
MAGSTPSPAFLERIRRGEIGGVVLYSENYGPAGPAALIAQLQAAAHQGGNPRLLIAIDQEGGIVKRLPGPPTLAPPQMDVPVIAQAQGRETGLNLAHYGINVDFAPVLDIGRGGFITPRTFGSTAAQVTSRAVAFLHGLLSAGVMPTAKHFPGLGYATTTTDDGAVAVTATRAELIADLAPYRAAIAARVPLIMVSTASYPGLRFDGPAALSATIVNGLLRGSLGYTGVVITDALDSPAITTHLTVPAAAVAALNSGVDMVLAAGTTSGDANQVSTATFSRVLHGVAEGRITRTTLEHAYDRILALKRRLPQP